MPIHSCIVSITKRYQSGACTTSHCCRIELSTRSAFCCSREEDGRLLIPIVTSRLTLPRWPVPTMPTLPESLPVPWLLSTAVMMFSLVTDTTREEKTSSPPEGAMLYNVTWRVRIYRANDLPRYKETSTSRRSWHAVVGHYYERMYVRTVKLITAARASRLPVAGWPDKSPGTRFSLCMPATVDRRQQNVYYYY